MSHAEAPLRGLEELKPHPLGGCAIIQLWITLIFYIPEYGGTKKPPPHKHNSFKLLTIFIGVFANKKHRNRHSVSIYCTTFAADFYK